MKTFRVAGIFASCAVSFLFANTSFAVKAAPVSGEGDKRELGDCREEDGNNLLQKQRHYLALARTGTGDLEVRHYFEFSEGQQVLPLDNGLENRPAATPKHFGQTPTWTDVFHLTAKDKGDGMQNSKKGLLSGDNGGFFGNESGCTASLSSAKSTRAMELAKSKPFGLADPMPGFAEEEKMKQAYSVQLTEGDKSVRYTCSFFTERLPDSVKCLSAAKPEKKPAASVFERTQQKHDPLSLPVLEKPVSPADAGSAH
jgi:hypothetical protein